ncbi:GTP 3',8-cyclase MoaA [Clostridium saccharobutylicum]|nr:cyclic pyranopterin phosphate synthase [Clostridium saccharobutylicum]MBA8790487.1 cyclic pyranopterin phosphate synthase [Clostridium saccharobutylicum]MBA8897259.1 cyclic pyranopterin phosphate synthase [Clostridium saccharobutylicum]MBA8982967.1 cyclic pyranopterin phosphate synthase [Clostridium saccharobutylicum]MBA8994715.1 cyclic pyranopterin phosphate synthase [Clostridium saccharobutylicum]
MMIDIYNRKIDYIRISVTDRCNLRCIYCMPEDGIKSVNHSEILSYEEIIHLCEAFAKIGISKIKITGGEPLVRSDLAYLIEKIKNINGINNVTLTTNGILLEEQIDSLVKAGLDAVNVSIDALDESTYKYITRIGNVSSVIRGINKALEYKNLTVKINCVPIDGTNGKQILDITKMAKNKKLNVRFIELMPIGLGKKMNGLGEDEIKEIIEEEFGELTPFNKSLGNGPSHYYSLEDFEGKIGFISAVSHKFCDKCNRVRLTSRGFLKTCLQYDKGINLKKMISDGENQEELIDAIKTTIYNKPRKNRFLEINSHEDFEKHIMSEIGG